MRTTRLLTVSCSISVSSGGSAQPPPARTGGLSIPTVGRPRWRQTPLDADALVMWPVMHSEKPTPFLCEQNDRQV